MTPQIAEIVGRENQPSKLTDLFENYKLLLQMSRDEMAKYYDQWDRNDMVYRGERKPDYQDKLAAKRGEPEKIVLPMTFGQVQTFVAFLYATYNGRDYFFETVASGAEDEKPGRMAEAVLEQNLYHNKFRGPQLIQFGTDIARFGLGITKETWVREQVPLIEEVPDPNFVAQAVPGMVAPAAPPMIRQMRMVTEYLGNKIVNVSPYRWFPDARLPITRWSEGEFCADEIEESVSKLQQMERDGTIAGLEHVPTMASAAYDKRRLQFMTIGDVVNSVNAKPQYYLLTELQVRLNPAQTEIDDGVFLDPAVDAEVIYIVWILNDGRIVRLEEAGYNHNKFGWNVAQLFDDQNRFINFSLCEILGACQDTATWFINSHITSVRKSIFTQFVVDPSGIEMIDMENRSPVIRTKPGRAGSGVDQWIKQLPVTDVTQSHVGDVGVLNGMAKEATGINETLLGQFSPGRRSAREASNVANYAAARLMMCLASIWDSALAPMGAKMLSNLRQGLDEETMVRIYGTINTREAASVPDLPGLPPPLYRLIGCTKADLVGNYDFAVFNGTLPTQRQQIAGVLQEILATMQKDPRMMLISGLDPQLIFQEVLQLLNIRNVQRLRLTPERLQQLAGMVQPAGNQGTPRPAQAGVNGSQGPNGQPNPAARSGAPAR